MTADLKPTTAPTRESAAEATGSRDDKAQTDTEDSGANESAVRFDGAFVGLSRRRLAAMVCRNYDE